MSSRHADLPPVDVARRRRVDLAICGLTMLLAAVVLTKDISTGGFRHGDATAHAMDGILIHDWIAAGPDAWFAPTEFAERQYAHYPALGIGRHHPPGYAMVEAGFFAAFGVSIFSARLCAVCFGMIAAAGTYTFTRFWADRLTAALASIILLTLPATTTWGRQNMLEVPTLAVMIWAAVALAWYLRQPTGRRLACVITAAIAAIFFKQPAVFLMSAVALTVVYVAVKRRCHPAHAVVAVVLAVFVTTGTVLSLGGAGRKVLSGFATFSDRFSFAALTFYARQFPHQVSWPVLMAAILGIAFSWRRLRTVHLFLIAWLLACYAMLTIADYKNPRFLYFALFPPAVWAAFAAGAILARVRTIRLRFALAGAAAAACCAVALTRPVKLRPDYGPVVQAHRDKIEDHVVLFSGLRDADFIFAVREHLPWRRSIILRGSKLLYNCNVLTELDFVSKVSTTNDVAGILDHYAFRHVFVERENKLNINEDALLREYLSTARAYRLAASHPLQAHPAPTKRDVTIDVYEAHRPRQRLAESVDIDLPNAALTIRVDLTEMDE